MGDNGGRCVKILLLGQLVCVLQIFCYLVDIKVPVLFFVARLPIYSQLSIYLQHDTGFPLHRENCTENLSESIKNLLLHRELTSNMGGGGEGTKLKNVLMFWCVAMFFWILL